MKRLKTILLVVVMIHLGGAALAQTEGALQGVFMELTERTVNDRACAALVVKPFTRDDHLTVLIPQEPSDLARVARRLRPGHRVEIDFVLEGGHRWLRGLDAQWQAQGEQSQERIVVRNERREGPFEKAHERIRVRIGEQEHAGSARGENSTHTLAQHLEQLGQQFRQLAARVSRMEQDMQALRTENARLRRMLGERQLRAADTERRSNRRSERDREPGTDQRRSERRERRVIRERVTRGRATRPALPDSLLGFQGVLTGKVIRKMDRGFVLKLEGVTQVWEKNEADNPQAALGKALVVLIRPEQGQGAQFMRTLRALGVGQDVLVEAFHLEGEHLTVVEQLQPLPAKPG